MRRFLAAGFLSLEAVWAAWVINQASEGGLSLIAYLAYFYGGALFGLGLVVWFVLGPWNLRRPAVLFQAIVLVLVFILVTTDAGFRVRLALSKGALRAAAVGTVEGTRSEHARWIGLFRVRELDKVGGAARFITASCGLDDCGVAYGPSGRPPRVGEDSYADLGGGWWHWHRSW